MSWGTPHQARADVAELRAELETWKDTAGIADTRLSEARTLLIAVFEDEDAAAAMNGILYDRISNYLWRTR